MTEAEWLDCSSPGTMLRRRRGQRMSTRKLRLLACACCRRPWRRMSAAGRNAVAVAERYADGEATPAELEAARPSFVLKGNLADNSTHYAAAPNRIFRSWVTSALTYAAWAVAVRGPRHEAELAAQCRLIRDVFGPTPFRAVAVAPAVLAWQGGTVLRMAQAIYDERAFDRLPILADALEEAGCADADVLSHCRGPGPHVRGCWVIDLLLGKQ